MNNKWKTAAEIMAELEKDPAFCARRVEKEKKRMEREQRNKVLLAPLLDELGAMGLVGASLKDIIRKYAPLPSGTADVLLSAIPRLGDDRLKESIVRTLAATQEPYDGRALADCFATTESEGLRWAIINTIALTHPHSIESWVEDIRKSPYWDAEFRKLTRQRNDT